MSFAIFVAFLNLSAIAAPFYQSNLQETPSSEEETDWQIILVGLIASAHREIPAVLVRAKIQEPEAIQFQQWLIPYQSVIEVLNFEQEAVGDNEVQLSSPGLVTRLDLNELSENSELGLVLSIQDIEEKLAVDARFDLNEYAIVFSAPWLDQRRRSPIGFEEEPEPQLEGLPKVSPPAFSLTALEQVTTFTPSTGLSASELEGDLLAIGTFLEGSWQIEIGQDKLDQRDTWNLEGFEYFRPTPKHDLIVGEQSPFWIQQGQGEYWGMTYLQREDEPDSRLGRVNPEQRLQTNTFRRDITGEAAPGTLVQLTRNRNQEVLDEVLVDADGTYRFENVPFGGRRFRSEYEVLLFPEGQLTLDPAVRTVSFRPLPEQLPSGRVHWLVSAGSRREQNDRFMGEFSELAGGATVRWGVAENMTLGVGLIHDQGTHGWGELFFRPMNVPLDLAIAGVFGKDLEMNINYQPTSTLRFNFNRDRTSSNFRSSWQILPNLRVSGRWDSEQRTEFRINTRFRQSIDRSTRIEVTLDDTNEIQWQMRQQWGDLELSHEDNNDSTRTEISYDFANDFRSNQESRLIFDYETRQFNDSQQLATLSWEYRSRKRDVSGEPLWDLELGYGIGSQGQGIQADVETMLLPGLRLRGRYEGVSLSSAENRLSLELTTRMNLQQSLSPGDRDLDDLQTQGGFLVQPFFDHNGNGQLDPNEEVYTDATNLLILNGDPLRESRIIQQRDRLLVTVPPDDYRLELDPAGFPLDWQAADTTFAIKVVPGSYTPLTVPLKQSYTVSGVLTNENNEPIGGARVVAIPQGEGNRRFSITNQGGVFFLERLQQGTYQLQVQNQPLNPSAITIDENTPPFQQQNLTLPRQE